MNVLQALHKTYLDAERFGMVGKEIDTGSDVTLLPLFSDTKKSDGWDVLLIKLGENNLFINAEFLPKDKRIIFPVTESSIGRSSGISPQPLVDKLKYVSPSFFPKHHDRFISQIEDWLRWAGTDAPGILSVVANYLFENDIVEDIVRSLSNTFKLKRDKSALTLTWMEADKEKNKTITLPDVYVMFEVESSDSKIANLSTSTDGALYANHKAYMEHLMSVKEKHFCAVTGDYTYCTDIHPGVIGNSKLVATSTHDVVHFGRFKDKTDIVQIGFDASQRIHLMLKFLLNNPNNHWQLGKDLFLVNWFSNDIQNEQEFFPTMESPSLWFSKADEEKDDVESLGGAASKNLNQHMLGKKSGSDFSSYYVMVVEKVNDGRVAIKYFRALSKSDLEQNVNHWYESFNWLFYEKGYGEIKSSPSLFALITALLGDENDEGLIRINGKQNEKIRWNWMIDLLPCVLERKPLPQALARLAFANGKKRLSYKQSWDYELNVVLSTLAKYNKDSGTYQMEDEKYMLDPNYSNRSYLYGRILAIYDRAEADFLYYSNLGKDDDSYAKATTNAQRLWTAYAAAPSSTAVILRGKVQLYLNKLRALNPKRAEWLDKELEDVYALLEGVKNNESNLNKPLDEEYLFGYYSQKRSLYPKKKSEDVSEETNSK